MATRKPNTTAFWTGRLPHWEVEGGRYFITIHLAGAIPNEGRRRLRTIAAQLELIRDHATPEWLRIQRMIFAEMVVEAIVERSRRGDWQMFQYVVMPTHIHMFCELGRSLQETCEDFKRWTGHRAAQILGLSGHRFWQREWFDHWSRSDEEDEKIVRYIRDNPLKAGLVEHHADWQFGSSGSSK